MSSFSSGSEKSFSSVSESSGSSESSSESSGSSGSSGSSESGGSSGGSGGGTGSGGSGSGSDSGGGDWELTVSQPFVITGFYTWNIDVTVLNTGTTTIVVDAIDHAGAGGWPDNPAFPTSIPAGDWVVYRFGDDTDVFSNSTVSAHTSLGTKSVVVPPY